MRACMRKFGFLAHIGTMLDRGQQTECVAGSSISRDFSRQGRITLKWQQLMN